MAKQTSLTKVTQEQWDAIRSDLEALLEVQQKDDESLEDYALRLAKRTNDKDVVSDDEWETLDETTQLWVNGAIDADEKGKPVPLPLVESGAAAAPGAGRPASAKEPPKGPAKEATPNKAAPKKASSGSAAKTQKPSNGAAPAGGAGRRGRRPKHGEDAVIKLASSENPHRKGAKDHEKFVQLKRYDGKTLGKALAAGIEPAYIRYLEKRELVSFQAAS